MAIRIVSTWVKLGGGRVGVLVEDSDGDTVKLVEGDVLESLVHGTSFRVAKRKPEDGIYTVFLDGKTGKPVRPPELLETDS